jgi:trehalose 6-phosphate phosphatase
MEMAAALALLVEHPERAALFTDYDGTLAPIVDDPQAAVPVAGAGQALGRAARRLGLVAVVSGRPVAWLCRQLGDAGGVVFAGLYGLERIRDGEIVAVPGAQRWREVIEEVAAAADAEMPVGVLVERKGLALTLHARTAPAQQRRIEEWAARRAEGRGLISHPGRRSVELRPPVPIDKGTVVSELAEGYDAVCFIGDDRGDLAAFEALGRLAGAGVHTVAVAVASDESPKEVLDAADLVLDGPPAVLELLRRLG